MTPFPTADLTTAGRRITGATLALLLTLYGAVLCYALPRTIRARVYVPPCCTGEFAPRPTIDASTVSFESPLGEPLSFRNADTGWGFPPYGKFDSEEIERELGRLAEQRTGEPVWITYYGFWVPVVGLVPNIVALDAEGPPNACRAAVIFWALACGQVALAVVWALRARRPRVRGPVSGQGAAPAPPGGAW